MTGRLGNRKLPAMAGEPTPTLVDRIGDALIYSFISALAGWAAGVVAILLYFAVQFGVDLFRHTDGVNLFGFMALVGFFSGFVVMLVWLCLLWPLYTLVPNGSVLWRPAVCVTCGVAVGGLLAVAWDAAEKQGLWNLLSAAPLIGGVTCAVGCRLHRLQRQVSKASV